MSSSENCQLSFLPGHWGRRQGLAGHAKAGRCRQHSDDTQALGYEKVFTRCGLENELIKHLPKGGLLCSTTCCKNDANRTQHQ